MLSRMTVLCFCVRSKKVTWPVRCRTGETCSRKACRRELYTAGFLTLSRRGSDRFPQIDRYAGNVVE